MDKQAAKADFLFLRQLNRADVADAEACQRSEH